MVLNYCDQHILGAISCTIQSKVHWINAYRDTTTVVERRGRKNHTHTGNEITQNVVQQKPWFGMQHKTILDQQLNQKLTNNIKSTAKNLTILDLLIV